MGLCDVGSDKDCKFWKRYECVCYSDSQDWGQRHLNVDDGLKEESKWKAGRLDSVVHTQRCDKQEVCLCMWNDSCVGAIGVGI